MKQDGYQPIEYRQETLSKPLLHLTMIAFIILGSCVTIFLKIQDSVVTTLSDGSLMQWHHPFVQTGLMFFGESLCGLLYLFYFKARVVPTGKPKTNPLWFLLTAILDIISSGLLFIGLTIVAASVYQMMRGFAVVATAAFSITLLKRKLICHHYFGIVLVIIGIFLVGLTSFINQSQASRVDNQTIGLTFLLLGQIFQGLHYVAQEYCFKLGELHPFELIGWEGSLGLILHFILLPLFYVIPCTHDLCSNGRVEDALLAFQEMSENSTLIFLSIGLIIVISIFNGLGVTITKYASAAQRCIVDQSRVIFVWMFFLAYPGIANEQFRVLQLLGFLILVIGTLMYNEIILHDQIDKLTRRSKRNYGIQGELSKQYEEELLDQNRDK